MGNYNFVIALRAVILFRNVWQAVTAFLFSQLKLRKEYLNIIYYYLQINYIIDQALEFMKPKNEIKLTHMYN